MDGWLDLSGVAHLRSGDEVARALRRWPDAVPRSVTLADELAFDLRKASPRLPKHRIPEGHTADSWLRELVWRGFEERYAGQPHADVARERIEHELRVVAEKDFAGYFVIVHDIVDFARRSGILCQGRGSAASSAVCYALGITAVDAVFYRLPFERFISAHRDEEPDIDVDFDSDRREEVIQWVYDTYGRHNAAQVANVISYRPRMAVRDAAKALGHSSGQQDAWSKQIDGWQAVVTGDQGDAAAHDVPAPVVALAEQLMGAPRHLGIHSGGMVLTERPIGEVCPIERARMERRTVLQWDKDACETMGLVKFDLLGLGMLGALDHMMRLAAEHTGESWDLVDDAQGGARRLRHALPRRLGRRVPGGEPGPDRHPAPAPAPRVLRPGHRDRADPARARSRAGRCTPTCAGPPASSPSPTSTPTWSRCWSGPAASRSSRSS